MSRSRALPLFALLVTLGLGGCVTWQPVTTPPAELIAAEAPERIRITTSEGVTMTLHEPEVRAGALVSTLSRAAALIEDIEVVEVERVSVLRTIALTAPAAIVVAVIAWQSCRC